MLWMEIKNSFMKLDCSTANWLLFLSFWNTATKNCFHFKSNKFFTCAQILWWFSDEGESVNNSFLVEIYANWKLSSSSQSEIRSMCGISLKFSTLFNAQLVKNFCESKFSIKKNILTSCWYFIMLMEFHIAATQKCGSQIDLIHH